MRRIIFVPILITVALLAIIGGVGYYIYNNYQYYTTDDAQVTGNIVSVSAPANGQLTTLSAKLGDKVTPGQTIGTITETIAATATTASHTAEANLTSPIAGTIIQTSAVQGQAVSPGLTLLQVTDLNTLTVTAYIDESQINNIKVGQDVDIHVDAFGNTNYTGHVQQIVQAAASEFSLLLTQDNASGNFTKVAQRVPVVITLDGNSGNDLVPGLSTEATIHLH